MDLLYALQIHDQFVYNCNSCKTVGVQTRYHCSVCEDFDLCVSCYGKEGHKHCMKKLGPELEEDTSGTDQKQVDAQESRKLCLQRCVQSLGHSSNCIDAYCRYPSCLNLKKIVTHFKQCKLREANPGCSVCKEFIALCYHHAKACQRTKCVVPYCLDIRHKIRQQQIKIRKQKQYQFLRRRIASMQISEMPTSTPPQSSSDAGSAYAASQTSPAPMPPASPYPTQPGLDMTPMMMQGMNPTQIVQGQTVPLTMPQHMANLSYGKHNPMVHNPGLSPNIMAQQQLMQKPMPELITISD